MKVALTQTEVQDNPGTDVDISPVEIRQALSRIKQSKYFSHAPKKQKFVQVIVEYYLQGRAVELNEYLIGCEVFDKGADYHPAADPAVRVAAHDVRKKLEAYYTREGAADKIRMSIPVGTYMPVFSRVPPQPASTETRAAPAASTDKKEEPVLTAEISHANPMVVPTTRLVPLVGKSLLALLERHLERRAKPLLLLAGLVILSLLAGNFWLLRENRALQHRPAARSTPAPFAEEATGIWRPFLANQFSTLLILSNPVVYRTLNGADPDVLTKKGIALTVEQANLLTNLSNDRLPLRPNQPAQLIPAFNTYTGIGEAIGAFRLQGLLLGAGETSLLKQSRSVGADDLKDYDVILLGSVYANQWAKPFSLKENFVFTDRTSIENLSPRAGEQPEYKSSFDQRTGALLEDYALITVVPGMAGTNVVMSLAGIYSEGTQAAVEYVTDKAHLDELQQKLQGRSGKQTEPRYFQALLKVRVENSFPTQTVLLTVREL
jgi:hypothetical protein